MNLTARLCVAAFALSLVAGGARAGEFPDNLFFPIEEAQKQQFEQLIGKPAPAITLTGWMNGEVTPADMKGKVVVVDIWATWCGPCIRSIPHNNELVEKFGEKGLVLIGVCSSGNGQEKMEQVAQEKGIKYPVGKDASLKVEKDWKVGFYPTYAVIDRNGKVRAIGLTPKGVDTVVEKLLAESASAKAN